MSAGRPIRTISASWRCRSRPGCEPAPLTERETDAARLHPYHGERALASLGGDGKAVAALVLRHHERLDGSGYHRYARGNDLSPAARILAAAEAFQTAREARPHRPR